MHGELLEDVAQREVDPVRDVPDGMHAGLPAPRGGWPRDITARHNRGAASDLRRTHRLPLD